MLHPLIVEGRAENLLSEQYQLEQTLPRYIKSLIDSNIKRNLPKMTLHDLNYRYYGEGMDPFMPIIADRETIVDIVGLGFFNHDKLVYKTGTDSFFAFKALYEDSNDATYQFEWKKKNKSLSVISIQSNQKKKWVSKNKLEITVKIEGYIAEAESLGLDKPQNKRKLEKQIGEKLEEECSELIKKFQELDIDPLMIGASAKSTFRDWNKKEWEETYPTIDIQPKIYFHIKQTNLTK
ncbi:Ger(x)C family spore germination C-terminal domain-containing protein [Gracilibacillus sp. JCM 18860]